jgi:hypothetical protein
MQYCKGKAALLLIAINAFLGTTVCKGATFPDVAYPPNWPALASAGSTDCSRITGNFEFRGIAGPYVGTSIQSVPLSSSLYEILGIQDEPLTSPDSVKLIFNHRIRELSFVFGRNSSSPTLKVREKAESEYKQTVTCQNESIVVDEQYSAGSEGQHQESNHRWVFRIASDRSLIVHEQRMILISGFLGLNRRQHDYAIWYRFTEKAN